MADTAQDLGAFYNEQISKTKIWQVIGASSVGTMIEWYDFYIFGSLAGIIAPFAILPKLEKLFEYRHAVIKYWSEYGN